MPTLDLTGQRFGRWLVLSPSGKQGQYTTWFVRCDCGVEKTVKWNCRCHCGKKITVFTANLKKMQSCGCLTKEILSKAQTKHGLSKDPSYLRALKALYKYRRKLRTPLWVDTDRLTEIYMNCPEGYQVDHIIPLSGEKVSGLHVPENLQYLSAEENNRKRNKFTPFIISISESNETTTASA